MSKLVSLLAFAFTLVLLPVFLFGQQVKPISSKQTTVHIDGNIDGKSFQEMKVIADVVYDALGRAEDVYGIHVAAESSGMAITNVTDFAYVRLTGGDDFPRALLKFLFFVSPGDSLVVQYSGDKLTVTGAGSARINCLWEISQYNVRSAYLTDSSETALKIKQRSTELVNFINNPETVAREKWTAMYYNDYLNGFELFDYLYQGKHVILERYKDKLTQDEYDLIAIDIMGERYGTYIESWKSQRLTSYHVMSMEEKAAHQKVFDDVLARLPVETDKPEVRIKSEDYLEYLAHKELLEWFFKGGHTENLQFTDFHQTLQAKYDGTFYDHLMTKVITLKNGYVYDMDEADFQLAVNSISLPKLSEIASSYAVSIVANRQPFYAFALPDTTGTIVTLEDFRGKLVVLDFWFTGCSNCVKLTEAMEPVYAMFKGRDDVVFVAINLDKSEKMWSESLNKSTLGSYSHPGSVNLTTAPEGFTHPLTKHHHIDGAPFLFLIDKEGRILDGKPPKPRPVQAQTNDNTLALMQIMEDYLMKTKEEKEVAAK